MIRGIEAFGVCLENADEIDIGKVLEFLVAVGNIRVVVPVNEVLEPLHVILPG